MTDPDLDTSWHADAECKKHDSKIFFTDYLSPHGRILQKQAIEICKQCRVIGPCLEYALKYERYGVWGGMTENQRAIHRAKTMIRTHLDYFNVASITVRKSPNATNNNKVSQ